MNHDRLKPLYLEPFGDQTMGVEFSGAYAWSCAHRHLLLNADGHMILLDDHLFQSLLGQKPEEDLYIKLLQRDFAHFGGQKKNESPFQRSDPSYFFHDRFDKPLQHELYLLPSGRRYGPDPRIISEEMIRKVCVYIAENCKRNQIDHIMVQPWGGEPLLEKQKIWLLQDELARHGVDARLTIETNGLLLDETTIQELYGRKISVSVSIDGFQSLHDSQRVLAGGRPTHKHVEDAIRRLQNVYGDDISIIATVTRHSAPCLEQMLDYFARDLHLKNIKDQLRA